eukprot:Seg1473.4 transcript_id=Seg1473.4/GoldUCD/mRNA.D3Y31 product="hypothetical protein" protein_id=Seg1473.4/GoldUCD/D3Y31
MSMRLYKMKIPCLAVFGLVLLAGALSTVGATGNGTNCTEDTFGLNATIIDIDALVANFCVNISSTNSSISSTNSSTNETKKDLKVCKGQVTFDSEGNDNKKSKYYSRKPHWPGGRSGLTIGRGYDMGKRTKKEIIDDLTKAGVAKETAKKLAESAGLTGKKAKKFLQNLKKNSTGNETLDEFELTREQQKKLFEITYAREEAETKRLVKKYYNIEWKRLHPKIQQILVDLKFRGDFRPTSKAEGQRALKAAVEANDLEEFKKVMANKKYWKHVPKDRFERRNKFLNGK